MCCNHQVADQKKVKTDLENQLKEGMTRAENDLATAKRHLEGEKAEKMELEAQLIKEIETAGEAAVNQAVEKAVAVWEVRYQKLREEAQVWQIFYRVGLPMQLSVRV